MRFVNKIVILLLQFYKKWISPLLGNNCRFMPRCSDYAMECFRVFPFPKAFLKTTIRLLKCHPYHPGGDDPVIKKNTLQKG